jgi:hypothetical protein
MECFQLNSGRYDETSVVLLADHSTDNSLRVGHDTATFPVFSATSDSVTEPVFRGFYQPLQSFANFDRTP